MAEEERPKIDWEKYGFKKFDLPSKKVVYARVEFPLVLAEDDKYLTVVVPKGNIDIISRGQIPATNQAVVLLLKAFNCPKLP